MRVVLSLLDIAVFIVTIRPRQAIFEALSESDLGKGLKPGLCISFMALSVDQMIIRIARRKHWVRTR
jgi:ABC-type proline/glycine betaine transport system permease subunit